ncbi:MULTISPECIES: succinylglutamate desuccinylase/aspartoacylase family protein [Haloferacaceae]|uniref:Succinylglutamate desuccinylase/aspartoacylase family protein n=1 Tax=Halorubrum glutamatedens TaxID=2707018 RepID=A0ABD5QPC4_9EURY|nr:succinylglutamate desuccinylase/aspartoacylase family protein [Halobellus captivus]
MEDERRDLELGSASAAPGTVDRGWLEIADLPTGTPERLPVIVANGSAPGPTLWLTGGVHGDEATGIAVVLETMDALVADSETLTSLAGAVVAVPVVSPAGLRRNARHTYYDEEDPNRHFPDADAESARPPKLQERIDARLYEAVVGKGEAGSGPADAVAADALIDCHTAGVDSEPFAIRDRVLYGDRRGEAAAEALAADLESLVEAFGFPTLTEYPAAEYVEEELQRSLAGAVLNEAGIPAFTAELGSHSVVDDRLVAGGVAGAFAVAVELGLLASDEVPEGVGEPAEYVDERPVDYPVRRYRGPTTDVSGLVRHRVDAGEEFVEGDALATVVSATGEPLGRVRADHDGYVVSRCEGLAVYEGDPIASLAVRDDGDLVVPRDD